MPNPLPSALLVAELEQLRADLSKINAAIDIIGAPAIRKGEVVAKNIEAVQKALAAALAAEADAARKERLAGFRDITVTVTYPGGDRSNLLRAHFAIDYTRDTYDMRARRSVPMPHKVVGFQAMPTEAYEYLVEVKPEAIPAEIMALAPGDPRTAFARYFRGLRSYSLPVLALAA